MSDPTKILVIFDLDFTLIDNSIAIYNAFKYAFSHFQVNQLDNGELIKKIGLSLKTVFLDYLDEARAEKAVQLFREYYSVHFFEGIKFLPGAIDILETLSKLGYKLALSTSKKTDLAIKLVEHIGLKKYFSFVLGDQEGIEPKPSPDPLKYIISQFPGIIKAYMIGDHLVDLISAQKAQINFIGVLTGNTSEKEFRKYARRNTIIIQSVKDIRPSRHLI